MRFITGGGRSGGDADNERKPEPDEESCCGLLNREVDCGCVCVVYVYVVLVVVVVVVVVA
jgi:hypothetical protein